MINIEGLSKKGNYDRLTKDEYFSYISLLVSQRSTCKRLHVGAVFTNHGDIVSSGYNGSPTGQPHCLDVGCLMEDGHCIRCIHAEQNAIIQLGHNYDYDDLELYVTDFPCKVCAKMLCNLPLKKIHFVRDYRSDDEYTLDLYKRAGIQLIKENILDED